MARLRLRGGVHPDRVSCRRRRHCLAQCISAHAHGELTRQAANALGRTGRYPPHPCAANAPRCERIRRRTGLAVAHAPILLVAAPLSAGRPLARRQPAGDKGDEGDAQPGRAPGASREGVGTSTASRPSSSWPHTILQRTDSADCVFCVLSRSACKNGTCIDNILALSMVQSHRRTDHSTGLLRGPRGELMSSHRACSARAVCSLSTATAGATPRIAPLNHHVAAQRLEDEWLWTRYVPQQPSGWLAGRPSWCALFVADGVVHDLAVRRCGGWVRARRAEQRPHDHTQGRRERGPRSKWTLASVDSPKTAVTDEIASFFLASRNSPAALAQN